MRGRKFCVTNVLSVETHFVLTVIVSYMMLCTTVQDVFNWPRLNDHCERISLSFDNLLINAYELKSDYLVLLRE